MPKIELEINNCKECPFWKEEPYLTEDSFERAHNWFCTKSGNKKIAGYVSWNEEKSVSVPDWCPIQTNEPKEEKVDLLLSRNIEIEVDDYFLEFSVLENEEGDFSMPSISVNFKRSDENEFWDNESWFVKYYKKDPEALGEISAYKYGEVRPLFEKILYKAVELGYIDITK